MKRGWLLLLALLFASPAFSDDITLLGVSPPSSGVVNTLWTPSSLGASLLAWWDASYTAGFTFNGSNVSAWADRANGVVVSQATGSAQPAYSATARNGTPGVTFLGSSSQILSGTMATLPQGTAASTLIVAAYGSSAVNNDIGAFGYGIAGTAQGAREINQINLAGDVVQIQNGSGGSTFQATAAWVNQDRFIDYELAAGATPAVNVWIDGTNYVSSTAVTNAVASTAISIGGPRRFFYGTVQQAIVVNATLTTSQRQKLEGWESWYDGKAGSNLPGGHPYKSRPPYTSDP